MGNMFVQVNGMRLGIEQRNPARNGGSMLEGRATARDRPYNEEHPERGGKGDRKGTPVQYPTWHASPVYCTGVPLRSPWVRRPYYDQPLLVLLHGFTGSAAGWGSHLEALAAYGWRVIALDLPGHGQSDESDEPQCFSMEYCQQYILTTLQELGVQPGEATLLGYSMGGRIALYTAFSGFFRALILESASPGLEDPVEREQRRISDEALAESLERDGVPAFVDRWEKLPLFASQRTLPPEMQEALRSQRLNNRASGLARSLRGVGTGAQPSLHARLPTLHIPVLLIAGELDTKFTSIAHSMAQALPQSELHIVPGAGHAVHLERPEEFNSLVRPGHPQGDVPTLNCCPR